MQLASFLNKLFKDDGFILIDANLTKYVIGNPKKEKPIILKLLDKKLHYKLLFYPDLYFGEAYANGEVKIENGSLSEFLDLALKNIGRNEINIFGKLLKKIKGSYRYLDQEVKLNSRDDWDVPDNIVIKDICNNSCCLKTEWCDSYKEYFKSDNTPIEACSDFNPLFRFND